MKDVFIYQIVRTPTAKKGGKYKFTPAENLAAFMLDQICYSLDSSDGQVQLAHSIGMMGNPARFALLSSTLAAEISATTIDAQCGGAYRAFESAYSSIRSGQSSWFVAGGMESSSLQAQRNYHHNHPSYNAELKHIDTAPFSSEETLSLNDAAERLAIKYGVSKREMMNWTVDSHLKSSQSFKNRDLKNMVVPFKKLIKDQSIKDDITFEKLSRLSSNSLIDRTNACAYYDGAGIVLFGDQDFGLRNEISPLAKVEAIEFIGCEPNDSPFGCVLATEKLLKKSGLGLDKIGVFEVCESYAVKPLAFSKYFKVPLDDINILGSNLAMGHPFASSGVLNLANLLCAMEQKDVQMGLVCAGIAGGLGAAMVVSKK